MKLFLIILILCCSFSGYAQHDLYLIDSYNDQQFIYLRDLKKYSYLVDTVRLNKAGLITRTRYPKKCLLELTNHSISGSYYKRRIEGHKAKLKFKTIFQEPLSVSLNLKKDTTLSFKEIVESHYKLSDEIPSLDFTSLRKNESIKILCANWSCFTAYFYVFEIKKVSKKNIRISRKVGTIKSRSKKISATLLNENLNSFLEIIKSNKDYIEGYNLIKQGDNIYKIDRDIFILFLTPFVLEIKQKHY